MKLDRGMWLDGKATNNPPRTTRANRNIIIDAEAGSYSSEYGFLNSSSDYKALDIRPIGAKPVSGGRTIIASMSTQQILNKEDEIGILYEDGTYETKVKSEFLKFSTFFPVLMEVQENYKKELIVALTDRGNTSPKVINIDDPPNPVNANNIRMFPEIREPDITTDVKQSGGSLPAGALYVFTQYIDYDGTYTKRSRTSKPVFIVGDVESQGFNDVAGSEAGAVTNKSVGVTLTNLDSRFPRVRVGYVTKVNEVLTVYESREFPTTFVGEVIIAGNDNQSEISIEEFLTPNASYSSIYSMTQNQNVLYIGNVEEESISDYQKYANNIRLKVTRKLVDVDEFETSSTGQIGNSKSRGFPHGETVAFYIAFKLNSGNYSAGFHIPGPNITGFQPYNDGANRVQKFYDVKQNATSLKAQLNADGEIADYLDELGVYASSPVYQILDTSMYNNVTFRSQADWGFWENVSETYPSALQDTGGEFEVWDSNGFTGQTLHGQNVRHHKFPTVYKSKRELYFTEAEYGKTKMDILGIEIDPNSLFIPQEIRDKVTGYEIFYVERTPYNSSVLGMDYLQVWGEPTNSSGTPINTPDLHPIGGNWWVYFNSAYTRMEKKELRFHNFDMLYHQPSTLPDLIRNELKYTIETDNFIYDPNSDPATKTDEKNGAVVYRCDVRVNHVGGTGVPFMRDHIREVADSAYLPAHAKDGKFDNRFGEGCIRCTINNNNGKDIDLEDNHRIIWTSSGLERTSNNNEHSYLTSLIKVMPDMYVEFENQRLVGTGYFFDIDDDPTGIEVYGGDIFTGYHSFWTYGRRGYEDIKTPDSNEGIKSIKMYPCEMVSNAGFRFIDAANFNSKFYPKDSDFVKSGHFYFRDQDPNQWQYSNDYSSIDTLTSITPFDFRSSFVDKFPHRVPRSQQSSSEESSTSWKTFLVGDYIEMPRDKGPIIHLDTYGDRIIIGMKNTTYVTVGNIDIQTSEGAIQTGSGDVFRSFPTELVTEESGYAGIQHAYATRRTKHGFVFLDAEQGKIFLISPSGLKEITTEGLHNFFRDNSGGLNDDINLEAQDNPFALNGFQVDYDERFDRLIIVKKYYTLTALGEGYLDAFPPVQHRLFLHAGRWLFSEDFLNLYEVFPDENTTLFEDHSWTITLNMKNIERGPVWASFHDYTPAGMFRTRRNLFSFKNGSVYRHNQEKIFGSYYQLSNGNKPIYDSYITPVKVSPYTSEQGRILSALFRSISWHTEVVNELEGVNRNRTFSRIFAWNSYQATEEIVLVVYDRSKTPQENYNNYNTKNIKNVWGFNKLRDVVIDTRLPIVENDSPVLSNIDSNKLSKDKAHLIDRFLVIKLLFDNEKFNNLQENLIFHEVQFLVHPVVR